MSFSAVYHEGKGWRVVADYTSEGGAVIDICGAVDEATARATAMHLAAFYAEAR